MLGAAALALAGCSAVPSGEAFRVLADLGAGSGESRLKSATPPPRRSAIAYEVDGRPHTADLYLPGEGAPAAGIVLVPGAVPEGKDEPRFVAFAESLARSRFAVVAPELSGFRKLRIRPADAREVADAFAWLADRADLAPGGRAGIGALSYAVGPALLAAMEPDVAPRVGFVVGIGGYHDLERTIRFFTTGHFDADGRPDYREPQDYGRLVLVMSALPYLESAADRAKLEAMVDAVIRDRDADLEPLAARLGPEGRSLYDLAANTDPARFDALFAAAPPRLREDVRELSVSRRDFARLRARLILLHGMNDPLIPYTESVALAEAAAPGQARLWLIRRVLGHVDLSLSHLFTWEFLTVELPDLWRMAQAVDALLAERGE